MIFVVIIIDKTHGQGLGRGSRWRYFWDVRYCGLRFMVPISRGFNRRSTIEERFCLSVRDEMEEARSGLIQRNGRVADTRVVRSSSSSVGRRSRSRSKFQSSPCSRMVAVAVVAVVADTIWGKGIFFFFFFFWGRLGL